jgi:hypothetical protein
MATPTRMPQYTIRNDGAGAYAVFTCEKCHREIRSQPARADNPALTQQAEQVASGLLRNIPMVGDTLASTTTAAVDAMASNLTQKGNDLLGGLLHHIPVVGDTMANSMTANDPRRAQTLTPQQLTLAWQEVQGNFRECPTCHQIVCTNDFDDASGFCNDHRQGGAAAPAAPTASYGYGYGDPAPAAPAAAAATASYGGYGDAAPSVAAAQKCANCGTEAPAGTKFCPNCGTKFEPPAAPAPTVCPSCGTETKGAKFCPNCGTKIS